MLRRRARKRATRHVGRGARFAPEGEMLMSQNVPECAFHITKCANEAKHGRKRLAKGSLFEFFRPRSHVLQRADVEERLLRQIVGFAVADRVEALEVFLDGRVNALLAGELLGDEEGLAEESFDLSGAADDELVLFAQFVDAKDRDDVL